MVSHGYPQLSDNEKPGGALQLVLSMLKSAGYGISFNLYNAANYGTAQKRERVVIVCSRDGRILPFLPPTHSEFEIFGLPKWKTFKEAVSGLVRSKHEYVQFPERQGQDQTGSRDFLPDFKRAEPFKGNVSNKGVII